MSIAEAITNAQNRVKAAYATCKDKGAKLPDVQDLANLPETIDSVKSGGIEVVQAYYNGTDVEAGKKVILTDIGYQALGDSDFIPYPYKDSSGRAIYLNFITEDGYIVAERYASSGSKYSRFNIVDGVVDLNNYTDYSGIMVLALSGMNMPMKNGRIHITMKKTDMSFSNYEQYNIITYSAGKGYELSSGKGCVFLDDLYYYNRSYSSDKIFIPKDDATKTEVDMSTITGKTNGYIYIVGSNGVYYGAVSATDNQKASSWDMIKFTGENGVYTTTSLGTISYQPSEVVAGSGGIALGLKDSIKVGDHRLYFLLSKSRYLYFAINEVDETQSTFEVCEYPQSLKDVLGTRTINKVQAFYDGTFSLDLSEGTTLICRFTDRYSIEVLETIEPFVIEGDSTIYHRNFTGSKMYWYLMDRPSFRDPVPYGRYNKVKAETDYLAVSMTENRFNSTVLTGFLTGQVDTIGGRDVVGVKTATKGTTVIDYSDVVNCYVSGVALGQPELNSAGTELEPSSVCDVDVILTKVGYQATGDGTIMPNPPKYGSYPTALGNISENGYIVGIYKTGNYYTIGGFDIIDGTASLTNENSFSVDGKVVYRSPFFMLNGSVLGRSSKEGMTLANSDTFVLNSRTNYYLGSYSISTSSCYVFLDFCYYRTHSDTDIFFFNDDLTYTNQLIDTLLGRSGTGACYMAGSRDLFYIARSTTNSLTAPEWEIYKVVKDGDTYNSTLIRTYEYTPVDRFVDSNTFALGYKDSIQIGDYRLYFLVHKRNYLYFAINEVDESLSTFEVCNYPENITTELGTRTVNKVQTFYDGTFSMDLSDGTTFICKFTDRHTVELLEVVEPFIIDGDTTIYHRCFSENKIYWYIEGRSDPLSVPYYGYYNKIESTVEWLAIPRHQNYWNSTVLTGVIRQSAQLAKPVFDDTGRRVIQVETTIKKNNCNDNATYEWTLEDYNRVNGIIEG